MVKYTLVNHQRIIKSRATVLRLDFILISLVIYYNLNPFTKKAVCIVRYKAYGKNWASCGFRLTCAPPQPKSWIRPSVDLTLADAQNI